MAYDLRDIPIPQFIPGPDKSLVVPSRDWVPRSIWELVFAPAVFEARPTDGPLRDSFRDVPLITGSTGCLARAHADYKDPCYFAASLLPPTTNEVAVLPTIEEERWMYTAVQVAPNRVRQFNDVGVQTDGEGRHDNGRFEDARMQSVEMNYEDDGSLQLSDGGVQTDVYVR